MADNQGLSAVSYLKLVIKDKNDNPMSAGASEIFVYNYEGLAPSTPIGRVYVTDPDDWDLPDKTFYFKDPSLWVIFLLQHLELVQFLIKLNSQNTAKSKDSSSTGFYVRKHCT